MVLYESGLEFIFSKDWKIMALDKHPFYQQVSGKGLKGVDFIGIIQGNLYLIEVKNYQNRHPNQPHNPLESLVNKTDVFTSIITKKWTDTLRLIHAVERFYNRKWYGKVFNKLEGKTQNWLLNTHLFQNSEYFFWLKIIRLIKDNEKVNLVLWLELEVSLTVTTQEKLIQNLLLKLKSTLPEYPNISILNSQNQLLEQVIIHRN